MESWWTSLGDLQKFLYIIAITSTIILFIQSLLTILGLDDGDGAFDSNFLDDFGDADFQFFSVRSIVAFFTLFGWTGALLSDGQMHAIFVLLLSTLAGLIGMAIVAYLFYSMSKLQHSGTLNYQNALGQLAEVYLPIPALRASKGKIVLTIQNRLIEADAITDEESNLETGTVVKVVGIFNDTVLLVKKI
jgi:hypothetical protein